MQRRVSKRLPASVQARLLRGSTVYPGVVRNLSEDGMFISTRMELPVNSIFQVAIFVNGNVLTITVSVRRSVKTHGFNDWTHFNDWKNGRNGMGVRLLNLPHTYLEYVNSLESSI